MSHLTTGQIAELIAIDRRGSGIRSEVQDLIRKLTAVTSTVVVDLDAAPFIPDGWKVKEKDQLRNPARGLVDLRNVGLHLSEKQEKGSVLGLNLLKELEGRPVLGANALDFLFEKENQHLIPEDWKGKYVFFWGTIYRRGDGNLCVRFLCWDGGKWRWRYNWLGNQWFSDRPAAVLESSA